MIRKLTGVTLGAVAIALVACGGSGSDGGERSPTVSASPTPAPVTASPTPTPGPSLELGIYSVGVDGSGLRLLLPGFITRDATPDGRYVAGAEFCAYPGHLQIVETQSGTANQVATFAGIVARIKISPDGGKIIVAEQSPEHPITPLLYLVDADGEGRPQALFEGWDVEWSPDGSRIRIIDRPPDNQDWTLSVFEVTTGVTILVDSAPVIFSAKWSPDSSKLAYSTGSDAAISDSQLWLWDRGTGLTRSLETGGNPVVWWPDGQSIVVVEPGGQNTPMVRIPIDGSSSIALGEQSRFAISSSGELIARRIFTGAEQTELRIAGAESEVVVTGLVQPAGHLSFSPDSEVLAFTGQEFSRDEGGLVVDATGVNVYTVQVDGSNVRRIADTVQSVILGWTPDGKVLFASVLGAGCERPFD